MAAALIRGTLSGRKSPDVDAEELADRYKLRITAGSSYDQSTHKPVYVNTDTPCTVENEFVRAQIKVRIRNYTGLPKGSKGMSPYFDDPMHAKDQYSVAFSFVPKKDLPCKDTVWGNDFDHPVRDRLPPGFNTAFKIVKEFIDPGLTCDAYAEQPWLYGPSLSCWFAFRIGDTVAEGEEFPAPDEEDVMKDGADGSGQEVRRKYGIPDSADKRKKYFLDAKNREGFSFEKGRCYQGDFFNPYLDFGKLALKLPGFSLGVVKYIDDKSHVLRYVFKNRETGDVYFNINFTLLFGEQLTDAMASEEEPQIEAGANTVGGTADGQKAPPGVQATTGSAVQATRPSEPSQPARERQEGASAAAPPAKEPLQEPPKPPGYEYPKESQQDAGPPLGDEKAAPKAEVSEITEMLRSTATHDETNLRSNVFDR